MTHLLSRVYAEIQALQDQRKVVAVSHLDIGEDHLAAAWPFSLWIGRKARGGFEDELVVMLYPLDVVLLSASPTVQPTISCSTCAKSWTSCEKTAADARVYVRTTPILDGLTLSLKIAPKMATSWGQYSVSMRPTKTSILLRRSSRTPSHLWIVMVMMYACYLSAWSIRMTYAFDVHGGLEALLEVILLTERSDHG